MLPSIADNYTSKTSRGESCSGSETTVGVQISEAVLLVIPESLKIDLTEELTTLESHFIATEKKLPCWLYYNNLSLAF